VSTFLKNFEVLCYKEQQNNFFKKRYKKTSSIRAQRSSKKNSCTKY